MDALPWPERLFEPGPKRILSIDGGGVRGGLVLGFLQKLEATLRERYGRPDLVLCDYFDLIGGTSGGALLAAGLALGPRADDFLASVNGMGPRLFGNRSFRIPFFQARIDPKLIERL